MPAALFAATALLVMGGTAAPARADSGDLPGAIVEQAVDAAQGIAAEALAGDVAAIGLAAPTDVAQGTPSPAPSGQGGAAPANGQAGAAPWDEEVPAEAPPADGPVQQDAPSANVSPAPTSSGDAGSPEPAPPAPAGDGAPGNPIALPAEPPLVADEPPSRIHEPGSEPPRVRPLRTRPRPALRPAPARPGGAAAPRRPAGAPVAAEPYAIAEADRMRKSPAKPRLKRPATRGATRSAAPPVRRGVPQHDATAAAAAGGSTASPSVATLPGVAALAAQGPLSRLLVSGPSWRPVSVTEPPERPG